MTMLRPNFQRGLAVPNLQSTTISRSRSSSLSSLLLYTLVLLLLLVWQEQAIVKVSAAGSNFNFDDLLNPKEDCPNYKCRKKGTSPVPKLTKKKNSSEGAFFTSTGCMGMQGGLSATLGNPKEKDEYVFEPCCDQWHACYQICGTSKQHCDDAFATCATEYCENNKKDQKDGDGDDDDDGDDNNNDNDCSKQVSLFKLLSKLQTCPKFTRAQHESCVCVQSSSSEERREAVIQKFYQIHAPDNVSKVSELAKKASTSGKMAALMRKLVAKYPKSIEKVKMELPPQPQQQQSKPKPKPKIVTTEEEEEEETDSDSGIIDEGTMEL